MKYNQKLPVKVEKELDAYIERVENIKWFKPDNLDKEAVDKQINLTLEAFGVKAGIEYRSLKKPEDWDAARDAARDAAWDAARDAAWDAARDAAWDAARDAAWDAARGAIDLLASLTPKGDYNKKYAQGNFLQLVNLWEMGLYPCGVMDGKFVCYVPDVPEADSLFVTKDSIHSANDIEITIKLPNNYLAESNMTSLTWIFDSVKNTINSRIKDAIVADQLERYAKNQPSITITPEEIKDKMLSILAERALEN